MQKNIAQSAMVAALAVILLGCGRKGPEYPSVKLEGAVTIAGKPLAEGMVMFMPHEQFRGGGVKASIKEGRYAVENVPLGKVRVTFNAMQETGRMIESASSPGKPLPEKIDLIPAKYKTGITVDVKNNQGQQDFNL